MMRFFQLSDEQCLRMPASRFFALYRAIAHLELEEEVRQISVVHSGDPKARVDQIGSALRKREKRWGLSAKAAAAYVADGVAKYESQAGHINEIRQRQRESAERINAERLAAKAAQKAGAR